MKPVHMVCGANKDANRPAHAHSMTNAIIAYRVQSLTHLSRMEFTSLINWISQFPFWMTFFIFIQMLIEQ